MKWTTKKPTEPGFYYATIRSCDDLVEVVEVSASVMRTGIGECCEDDVTHYGDKIEMPPPPPKQPEPGWWLVPVMMFEGYVESVRYVHEDGKVAQNHNNHGLVKWDAGLGGPVYDWANARRMHVEGE